MTTLAFLYDRELRKMGPVMRLPLCPDRVRIPVLSGPEVHHRIFKKACELFSSRFHYYGSVYVEEPFDGAVCLSLVTDSALPTTGQLEELVTVVFPELWLNRHSLP